jgi:polysaccharide export outer membrane protein
MPFAFTVPSARSIPVPSPRPIPLSLFLWGGLLLALGIGRPIALASSGEGSDPSSASKPAGSASGSAVGALPASYKLGPEDVIGIRVARHAEMDCEALVLEDGTITVPRVGRMSVAGRTVLEIQETVRAALGKILVNPEVSVAIKTPRVERVLVYGPVTQPGAVAYKEGYRVAEVLAQAGGLKVRSDWVTTTLTRKSGGLREISLVELLKNPASAQNVAVAPGDILMVQEIPPQPIFVGGAVKTPGMYDLREVDPKAGSIGVLEAMALAGGPMETAALSRAVLFRASRDAGGPRVEERVDLSRFRQTSASSGTATPAVSPGTPTSTAALPPTAGTSPEGTPSPAAVAFPAPAPPRESPEVRLYPGDTLQVPESTARIVVMGHVKAPGVFPLSEDRAMTLAEAIGLAGGPLPDRRARMDKVGIIRVVGAGPGVPGRSTILEANLNQLINRRDSRQNLTLQPGDVVYVPETSKPDWYGKIIPALQSIGSIIYLGGLTR